EEYVGHSIAEFYVDPEVAAGIVRRLVANESVQNQEAQLRCGDGSTKHLLISANGLWENGALVHARVFTRDVTELKRFEEENRRYCEEIEEARRRAEHQATELAIQASELGEAHRAALEATRSKSEFLANMSHEIRTPMTAILGYTDLLANPETSESERQSSLATIKRNGEWLLGLINDILDLSKIEAGKFTIERVDCEPVAFVGDVVSLMRAQAVDKGLSFSVEYQSVVPGRIHSDPT